QADFHGLNARLASEVLFHPVCSKVSGHAFDAHINVLNLSIGQRHKAKAEQEQCEKPSKIHASSFRFQRCIRNCCVTPKLMWRRSGMDIAPVECATAQSMPNQRCIPGRTPT